MRRQSCVLLHKLLLLLLLLHPARISKSPDCRGSQPPTASVPSAPANPSHGGFASDQHSLEDRPFPLCPSIKMRGVCFACAMHELLLQALPLPTAPVGHHQPISPALFFVPAYAFPAPKKPPIETYARCALRNVQSQHTTAQTRMPGENRGGHLHACLPFGDKQVMYPFMLINCMSLPA